MGLNYQKYINRLKQKRQDNPEYALYKQSMQAMAEPMKAMNRSMQGQMSMAGGSIGAIGSTYLQGQSAMQNLAMQSFGQADRAGIARNDALDNQITQMEMTRDAEEERKKNELTKSLITGAATIGGFALGGFGGAILGGATNVATDKLMTTPGAAGDTTMATNIGPSATPSAGNSWALPTSAQPLHAADTSVSSGPGFNLENAMLGSQIGAGIGGMGSSFVGGADYNALQQSIGDTLAGISSISTLKTHRQFLDTFREKYSLLNGEGDKKTFLTLLTLGDYKGAQAMLDSLQSPVADVAAVDSAPGADVAIDPTDPAVTVTDGVDPTQETKTTETGAGNPAETPQTIPTNVSDVETQFRGYMGRPAAEGGAGTPSGDNVSLEKLVKLYQGWNGLPITGKIEDITDSLIKNNKITATVPESPTAVQANTEPPQQPVTQELDLSNMTEEELSIYAQAKIAEATGAIVPKVDKAAFVAARKKVTNKTAYDAMFDYMEKNGLAYDSPAMKEWVEGKYKTAGTYNRFKKIYKAAGGGTGKTTAEQTPVVKPKEETSPPSLTAEVAADPAVTVADDAERDLLRDSANFLQDLEAKLETMSNEELENTYQQLKKNAAEGAAPRESATYGDSNAALGVKQGSYKVGKGKQFSRNTKTGELVVKVNGSYYKVRVNGNTIKVKVGDTVTVGADGKVEVK